jgi:hypothetical protein
MTALTLYSTTTAAVTLTTCNTFATTTGGSTATKDTNCGNVPSGYGQLYSQGNASAWPSLGSIGSPDGHGWFLESTSLVGQQILAGNWTPTVRMLITGTGAPTCTADMYVRAYKYNGGTYTLIGNMIKSAVTLNGTVTNYTFSATSLALTTFATGDVLYIDSWLNVSGATTVTSVNNFRISESVGPSTGQANNFSIVTPGYQAQTSPALTVYAANAASGTLSTADIIYITSGTPATTQTFTLIDNSTGYVELYPQGNPSVNGVVGSLPSSPSGHGFLWDVTTLEGNSLASGNYSGNIRLSSQQAQTFTADIYRRVWKRSSGGTYTAIVTLLLTAQSFTGTNTTYALPSTSASGMAFATGDKLYIEDLLHITVNGGGTGQQVRYNRLSTDTVALTGDATTQTVTPGYAATVATTSAGYVIGDSMLAGYIPGSGGML